MRIPPLDIKIMIESNPLKSRIVVRRLAVVFSSTRLVESHRRTVLATSVRIVTWPRSYRRLVGRRMRHVRSIACLCAPAPAWMHNMLAATRTRADSTPLQLASQIMIIIIIPIIMMIIRIMIMTSTKHAHTHNDHNDHNDHTHNNSDIIHLHIHTYMYLHLYY